MIGANQIKPPQAICKPANRTTAARFQAFQPQQQWGTKYVVLYARMMRAARTESYTLNSFSQTTQSGACPTPLIFAQGS